MLIFCAYSYKCDEIQVILGIVVSTLSEIVRQFISKSSEYANLLLATLTLLFQVAKGFVEVYSMNVHQKNKELQDMWKKIGVSVSLWITKSEYLVCHYSSRVVASDIEVCIFFANSRCVRNLHCILVCRLLIGLPE